MDLERAEKFFGGKIRNQAGKEGVEFTVIEEQILFGSMPRSESYYNNLPQEMRTFYETPGKLKVLNNKVILLLRRAMQDDLACASNVKTIRLSWLKWFKMPSEWHDAYMTIYETSDKYLTGVLQNFVIGNPFEHDEDGRQ
ncbi:MAG: hypothetical protein KKA28_17465 [Planctomycetes bacterium]|nr:hypothetical protein [Planctomycetota bacterium]MCG2685051.1 hypothetical protein [Planctomycetales bacterium]